MSLRSKVLLVLAVGIGAEVLMFAVAILNR